MQIHTLFNTLTPQILSLLCSVTTDLGHGSSGFWQSFSPATEGPLKISPLFPNGLSHRSRREGKREKGMVAHAETKELCMGRVL